MRVIDYVLDGSEHHLLAWLRRELPTAKLVWLRTGFFTKIGFAGIEPDLAELLDRGGQLAALVGGSPLQYEIPALRALLRLSDAFPGRVDISVVMAPQFQNAKTYLLQHADEHWSAWVGSANLSNGGMVSNFETAVIFDSREDGAEAINRLRDAHRAVESQATTRSLDARLLRQMQFGAQSTRFGAGRIDIDSPEPFSDTLQDVFDKLDVIAQQGKVVDAVSTGLADLDVLLYGGLSPGSLTVIASRPGAGRTTLALGVLRAAALREALPAAVFSFELMRDDIIQRIICAEARVRLADMRSGRMSEEDWSRIARYLTKMDDAPLFINTGAAPDLEAFSRAAIEAATTESLRLIVVDNISAIIARSFANSRERELAEIGRRLKALAMELEVPIVGCADLGRSAEYRADKRPLLSDLGEADALAHAADAIILIHRPDLFERDDPRAGEADLIVAKNRSGPTMTVTVAHQLHYSRFADLAR